MKTGNKGYSTNQGLFWTVFGIVVLGLILLMVTGTLQYRPQPLAGEYIPDQEHIKFCRDNKNKCTSITYEKNGKIYGCKQVEQKFQSKCTGEFRIGGGNNHNFCTQKNRTLAACKTKSCYWCTNCGARPSCSSQAVKDGALARKKNGGATYCCKSYGLNGTKQNCKVLKDSKGGIIGDYKQRCQQQDGCTWEAKFECKPKDPTNKPTPPPSPPPTCDYCDEETTKCEVTTTVIDGKKVQTAGCVCKTAEDKCKDADIKSCGGEANCQLCEDAESCTPVNEGCRHIL